MAKAGIRAKEINYGHRKYANAANCYFLDVAGSAIQVIIPGINTLLHVILYKVKSLFIRCFDY
jgi:hypothetical protein